MVIYRAKPTSSDGETASFGADEDEYDPSGDSIMSFPNIAFEKIAPGVAITGLLIAIKFCPANSEEYAVRDSAVTGYLYFADVDESRKKFALPAQEQSQAD
ncbi:Cleavage polyadenylation factor subunit clp1 [Elasticomyces elasticus]|nr:Cleavage polyadenylation factor subunit clp1 [Elasticomyces elasticus]